MQSEEIKYLIENGLTHAKAIVEGDGTHFTAIVICQAFAGKSRLNKQQLVYATVQKELLDGTLHALSVQTFTPEEWQSRNEPAPSCF